jgi:DNA (cytosine-5)-methyltransferase 1
VAVKFIDLFAGIGGFHAVGRAFGWKSEFGCEIDASASDIYRENWGSSPLGDITKIATDAQVGVPEHDVLFAGFPCQPFSKSGQQKGMEETRGTLFWNIAKIVEHRRPALVVLENVRNLAGPRHLHEWNVIIDTLRSLGYRVSSAPTVVSPHKIPPQFGGRPQSRERIFICATRTDGVLEGFFDEPAKLDVYAEMPDWNPKDWDIAFELGSRKTSSDVNPISDQEASWLDTWDTLQQDIGFGDPTKRPGFPLWADVWSGSLMPSDEFPRWKNEFILKNQRFFDAHRESVVGWRRANQKFKDFPPSRRKFEWQAGDMNSVWDGLVQFRPSGIRVKKANYAPAAVAINQTSVLGPLRRKLSVGEVAWLQGLPEWFEFSSQPLSKSYKQLGNGISVAAAYHAIKAAVRRDAEVLGRTAPEILKTVTEATESPDGRIFR